MNWIGTRAWRYIPGMHPGMECLISQAEGKPAPVVREHVLHCARCRHTTELLRAAVQCLHQKVHQTDDRMAGILHEVYQSLQVQMGAQHSDAQRIGRSSVPRKRRGSRRVLNALAFYFGDEIARHIDHCAGGDAADQLLVSYTKPFFAAFLGRKAAEALVQEVAGAVL